MLRPGIVGMRGSMIAKTAAMHNKQYPAPASPPPSTRDLPSPANELPTSSLTRVPNVDIMFGYFFGSDCMRVLTTSIGTKNACAVEPHAAPHAAKRRKTEASNGRSFSTGYLARTGGLVSVSLSYLGRQEKRTLHHMHCSRACIL